MNGNAAHARASTTLSGFIMMWVRASLRNCWPHAFSSPLSRHVTWPSRSAETTVMGFVPPRGCGMETELRVRPQATELRRRVREFHALGHLYPLQQPAIV